MGKTVGYIQADSKTEQLLQKAVIDRFARANGLGEVEYVIEDSKDYVSWKDRLLGKKVLNEMKKGDSLIVADSMRLGNSSPEVDVILMYFAEKGVNVYYAKVGMKIV